MTNIRLLFAATAILCANSAFANNVQGAWSQQASWPLIPIHTVLTADGRVMSYGTTASGQQTGKFIYDIWNPKAGGIAAGHSTLPNNTNTDIFCSSQIVLVDGRVLIAGGDNYVNGATTNTGNSDFTLFTPITSSLVRGGTMNRARWYSTLTTLPNGEVYLQGGSGGTDLPEIFRNGAFSLLSGANTGALNYWYPRNFVAPDGRIFGFDASGRMYWITTSGTGSMQTAGNLPAGNFGTTSSATMFLPGRILQIGDSERAVVIDITSGTPVVTATQPMATLRRWVTSTVLADGRVLATGGSAVDNQLTGVNNTAAIWNPATGTWLIGPSGVSARLYHSTATLLPDGSVLVGGGGAPGPQTNTNAEIYYPPYLYNAAGGFAARPTITGAPTSIEVNTTFNVNFGGTASSITKAALVKTGTVTHSFNMDQRYIPVTFTRSGQSLTMTAPLNNNIAPPGYYMLFVFNESGVPSEAAMIRVNPSGATVVTDNTIGQALGDGNGPAYNLSCNPGEVLAGITGNSAAYLDRVGPVCVPVNAQGAWTGSPVARGTAGGAGGAAFSRVCPTNQAVGQFRGRSGWFVDQVEIACQALSNSTTLTGPATFQPAAGGAGGSAEGPFGCPSSRPAYGVRGLAGVFVGSFGLGCNQPVNAGPSVAITSPANGAVFTAPATVTINANASDPDNNLARVEFYNGASLLGSDTTAPFSFAWTNAGAGTYTITARAVDTASATANANITITVNPSTPVNSAPTATITSPSIGATFTAPASITINANAADVDGNLARVEFYNGSTLLGSDTAAPFSFAWANVAAGSYTISARAVDSAGLSATATASVTVNASDPRADFTTTIVNVRTGRCITISGASTANGASAVQSTCATGTNQRFRFQLVSGTTDTYTMTAVHSSKLLDISGGSTGSGAPLIQWPAHGGTNQRFRIIQLSDGTFNVRPVHSNLYLGVRSSFFGYPDGAVIEQQNGSTSTIQRWRLPSRP